MGKKKNIKPSENELAILQILWEKGPSTVREVNELLSVEKPTGYTTTLKFMQIMHDKGLLSRTTEGAKGRSHIYKAEVQESQVNNHLLDQFVNRVFKGSTSQLVMRALGRKTPSAEEIEEIKKFLDKLDKSDES
ncbi:BlaI family penicillinase repressor [Catalinimonas alkaloidigena]|uniref:BlaI/MecI/CopY family transcriptional regulator n=1 Tax=Catalinimonas alkaloidigena TaxID=1075417 RepID=UPI002406DA5F|nr:BlaI/MecI/CopY family transcriptional regulator [Catalinimonas alkaloidigena]MDF9800515.1 BlaI family penicillinase repressor [Catalinimonas alkaloidigena]